MGMLLRRRYEQGGEVPHPAPEEPKETAEKAAEEAPKKRGRKAKAE